MNGTAPPAQLIAAQRYAAQGIPVIALHTPTKAGCSCGRDCDKPGKHPRRHPELLPHGLHSATTDPDLINTWWKIWPTANLGLRTGVVFDVIDIDTAAGCQELRDLLGDIKLGGPVARSRRGGWHLYIASTGYGNRVGILPGVDFRGAAGQITAPPSLGYRWAREIGSVPLPECPEPLLTLLCPPPQPVSPPTAVHDLSAYAHKALEGEAARVAGATQGTRNDSLNKAAYNLGRLVGGGALAEADVINALTGAAMQAKGDKPLSHLEIARTIGSGLRAGRSRPRTPELRGTR